jgi:hypothetical protein
MDRTKHTLAWILPYVDDFALWPVTLAVLGHFALVIGPLMLGVYRTGSVAAGIGMLIMLAGTAQVCRLEHQLRGRLGAMTVAMVLMWLSSVGLAVICEQTGVY